MVANKENKNKQVNENSLDEKSCPNKPANSEIPKQTTLFKPKLKNVAKFSYKSNPGIKSDGRHKTNQDNFIALTNLLNLDNYSIFGILDGHGTYIL